MMKLFKCFGLIASTGAIIAPVFCLSSCKSDDYDRAASRIRLQNKNIVGDYCAPEFANYPYIDYEKYDGIKYATDDKLAPMHDNYWSYSFENGFVTGTGFFDVQPDGDLPNGVILKEIKIEKDKFGDPDWLKIYLDFDHSIFNAWKARPAFDVKFKCHVAPDDGKWRKLPPIHFDAYNRDSIPWGWRDIQKPFNGYGIWGSWESLAGKWWCLGDKCFDTPNPDEKHTAFTGSRIQMVPHLDEISEHAFDIMAEGVRTHIDGIRHVACPEYHQAMFGTKEHPEWGLYQHFVFDSETDPAYVSIGDYAFYRCWSLEKDLAKYYGDRKAHNLVHLGKMDPVN